MLLMFQREVADRLAAVPDGHKNYGRLGVVAQWILHGKSGPMISLHRLYAAAEEYRPAVSSSSSTGSSWRMMPSTCFCERWKQSPRGVWSEAQNAAFFTGGLCIGLARKNCGIPG
jgi:hypothetical protein